MNHFLIFFVATAASLVKVVDLVESIAKKKWNDGARQCW